MVAGLPRSRGDEAGEFKCDGENVKPKKAGDRRAGSAASIAARLLLLARSTLQSADSYCYCYVLLLLGYY